MGATESHLKIQNDTSQNIIPSFSSTDKFDYCDELHRFNVLRGRVISPGTSSTAELVIKGTANGVMFTMELSIGNTHCVTIRMDQKISLKESYRTKFDFKDKIYQSRGAIGKIWGNGVYGCTGDVQHYNIRGVVIGDKTVVIVISDIVKKQVSDGFEVHGLCDSNVLLRESIRSAQQMLDVAQRVLAAAQREVIDDPPPYVDDMATIYVGLQNQIINLDANSDS